ncbi:Oidioi.mRNA.OKI2018_I69.XSR.g16866.t1.cds [Oikopleura dioica]|uniref:Oidioi.mRNA.OKI2018_I69.XSR.g16866.t1.cds n=1 Tax=Oikopleura dioica TaxID=34765 RepID=A0ABN7SHH0_OIKDI|nr:Oidioi.mRNA.OKI2018_I69.XSR.g16866.t1.cds [Oikopleura dioica]
MCRGENNMQRFIAKNWATDSVDKVHRRAGPKPIHRCEPCLGQLCDLIDIKEFWADYLVEIFCKRSDRKATDDFIKEKIASLQSNWTLCDHVIFDQNNTPKVKNIIATLDASNPTKLLVVVRNYQRTSKTPSAEEVEAVVPKETVPKESKQPI